MRAAALPHRHRCRVFPVITSALPHGFRWTTCQRHVRVVLCLPQQGDLQDRPRIGQEAAIQSVRQPRADRTLQPTPTPSSPFLQLSLSGSLLLCCCRITVPDKAPFSAVVQFAAKEVQRSLTLRQLQLAAGKQRNSSIHIDPYVAHPLCLCWWSSVWCGRGDECGHHDRRHRRIRQADRRQRLPQARHRAATHPTRQSGSCQEDDGGEMSTAQTHCGHRQSASTATAVPPLARLT
jgi:hypothetical protein